MKFPNFRPVLFAAILLLFGTFFLNSEPRSKIQAKPVEITKVAEELPRSMGEDIPSSDCSNCSSCSSCSSSCESRVASLEQRVASLEKKIQPVAMVSTGQSVKTSATSQPVVFTSPPVVNSLSRVRTVSSSNHWSYPGEITNHLQDDHGVSTGGMNQEEKLSLHDSIHERSRSVSTSVSSCPGGVCPTSYSSSSSVRMQTRAPLLRIFRR